MLQWAQVRAIRRGMKSWTKFCTLALISVYRGHVNKIYVDNDFVKQCLWIFESQS